MDCASCWGACSSGLRCCRELSRASWSGYGSREMPGGRAEAVASRVKFLGRKSHGSAFDEYFGFSILDTGSTLVREHWKAWRICRHLLHRRLGNF